MNKLRAVVTGGAGFIGSHLSERLIELGYYVHVVDDLSGGQLKNLASIITDPKLKFSECDITDPTALENLFETDDIVFHLAGKADIVPSIEDPTSYYQTNVTGTFNVCEAARKTGVKRLIYAASSSCYGIPQQYPTPETAPIQPRYPYALTKSMGESLVMHWAEVYKLPTIALRLFNVYGPRSRTSGAYGAVFGVFLSQKYHQQPFTVVGDGEQSRDFTYVTDVVDAFITAANSNISGEIYNVGSGNHYTVNNLITLLEGDTVHLPKRPGEPDCTFADLTKIKNDLNWQSKVSFEEGVACMLQELDRWADAPLWNVDSIKTATKTWFQQLDT